VSEKRKIAAILVADIVGYSRLTGADEEGTLARLRALRADLFNPTVALHAGRVVKRTGDGVIVEFRSVVEAVRCALDVTRGLAERNASLPPEIRIEVRTGIHLGDVIEEPDGDLLGDGVNIAARLEGISAPGGICLSEDAWRQVRDKISEPFADLGERELKNIVHPMRVYALGRASDPTAPSARTVPGAVAGVLQSVARLTDAYAEGAAAEAAPPRDRRRRTVEILRNVERIVEAETQRARRYRQRGTASTDEDETSRPDRRHEDRVRARDVLRGVTQIVGGEAEAPRKLAPAPLAAPDPRPAGQTPSPYATPAPPPPRWSQRRRLRLPIIATAILLTLATRACHDFPAAPPHEPPPQASTTAR
jgi:class 3 adenylate cyclase